MSIPPDDFHDLVDSMASGLLGKYEAIMETVQQDLYTTQDAVEWIYAMAINIGKLCHLLESLDALENGSVEATLSTISLSIKDAYEKAGKNP